MLCVLLLSIAVLFHHCQASEICPTPVQDDDVGVNYHTKERFDRLRKAVGNELKTTFVHHRVDGKNEEYDYIFNFCGANATDAVTQNDKSGKKVSSIAIHDSASVLVAAEDWILLQYYHGNHYHSHCNGQRRQAWISVRCEDHGEKPQLKVIEEARFHNQKKTDANIHPDRICYFLFEYNHPAVCTRKSKSLSGGAIFCIIVLVLFAAYLVCGVIYQRIVLGATGLDQIPHYPFWKKFGNTMADGCDFVCRTRDVTNSYKGITDDLDVETSDDDKDGLLPM